jgi:hypothetical protein
MWGRFETKHRDTPVSSPLPALKRRKAILSPKVGLSMNTKAATPRAAFVCQLQSCQLTNFAVRHCAFERIGKLCYEVFLVSELWSNVRLTNCCGKAYHSEFVVY